MRGSHGEVSYAWGGRALVWEPRPAFLRKPASDLPDDQGGHVLFLEKNISDPEKAL